MNQNIYNIPFSLPYFKMPIFLLSSNRNQVILKTVFLIYIPKSKAESWNGNQEDQKSYLLPQV